jgi:formylglycine-generating enzyme required for sulfatase activity
MKRILVFAAVLFTAGSLFAGSIVTQRVVNAQGFVKGSTTVSLSGQLDQAFLDSLDAGSGMAIYNYLDSYLTFPTLLPKTKNGYGTKSKTQSVSVSTKNGKFSWTEKDVTPYFAFVSGFEKIAPTKATFKSSGTLQGGGLDDLGTKKFTVFDFPCDRHGFGYLGSLAFSPEKKGKNYKFTYKEDNWQVKFSANAKGKATASYKLPPDAASPAFVTDEYVFTNLYDYTFEQIGEGTVEHGFIGPDQVELQVTENNDKFRYFLFNGEKITNDYLLADLEQDSEFTAVFGIYDLTVDVVGEGNVVTDFIGPDEVVVAIGESEGIYRYSYVDDEKTTETSLRLQLERDTQFTAVFGTYDLAVGTVGDGSVEVEFVDQDKAEVRIVEQGGLYRYALVGGERTTETSFTIQLDGNTDITAVFGQYALSVTVIGEGSVDYEFIGADEVEVTVGESEGIYRFSSVNGVKNFDDLFNFSMTENTELTVVFGTYNLTVDVVGSGFVGVEFIDQDEVEISIDESDWFYRYSVIDGEKNTETNITIQLKKDTGITAVFGQYDFSFDVVGEGSVKTEFRGPDEVELLVAAGKGIYRYTSVNGKKIYDSDIVLKLEEATKATVFFGTYNLTVNVVGSGSVNTEFIGPDEVTLTAEEGEDIFSNFTWGDNSSNYNPLTITLTSDTTVTATFKEVTRKYLVIDISGGPSAASWPYRYTSGAPIIQSNACRTTELWLRYIPAGTFTMGSPESEYGRGTREVAHEVTLTKDFYVGVFELTVKQYELITGSTVYGEETYPVVNVVYDKLRGTNKGAQWPASDEVDENSFMGIIRAKTGLRFDLPTEAQWEYACRAATTTAFNNGKNLDDQDLDLAKIAYYAGNAGGRNKVGSLKPNLWGLYDMHGNVWEWCLDWYTDDLGTDPVVDPVGLDEGTQKTLRGGSFNDGASACRSAYRAHTETDHNMDRLGFRPVVNQ